ncbi:hypothetical protein X801_07415, partial [Opisthorchis viverrini]
MGQANIPLRLTQRYAFELGWDLSMVAILMEAEREHRLREAGRPVVSFIDDIQSQRYLNCDGIKTGSIEDFLIGIGLPMYIDRVKRMSGSLSKSSQLEQSITPVQLLKMSDTELINEIGFTKGHLDWLRRESSLLQQRLRSMEERGDFAHLVCIRLSRCHLSVLGFQGYTLKENMGQTRLNPIYVGGVLSESDTDKLLCALQTSSCLGKLVKINQKHRDITQQMETVEMVVCIELVGQLKSFLGVFKPGDGSNERENRRGKIVVTCPTGLGSSGGRSKGTSLGILSKPNSARTSEPKPEATQGGMSGKE